MTAVSAFSKPTMNQESAPWYSYPCSIILAYISKNMTSVYDNNKFHGVVKCIYDISKMDLHGFFFVVLVMVNRHCGYWRSKRLSAFFEHAVTIEKGNGLKIVFKYIGSVLLLGSGFAIAQEARMLHPDVDGVQRATIVMESYSFTPHRLVVERGRPVELVLINASFLIPHTFLLDSPSGERLVEVSVPGGESATVRFTLHEPGTYPFFCDEQFLFFPNHREEGMEGYITVR